MNILVLAQKYVNEPARSWKRLQFILFYFTSAAGFSVIFTRHTTDKLTPFLPLRVISRTNAICQQQGFFSECA